MTRFYVKLREESSIYGEIMYPDCSLLSDGNKYKKVVIDVNPLPTIDHDVWIIRKDEIVPLNNDYRTYSEEKLKCVR